MPAPALFLFRFRLTDNPGLDSLADRPALPVHVLDDAAPGDWGPGDWGPGDWAAGDWLQGQKFDGAYARRWVPELAKLPSKHIHEPWEAPDEVLARAGVTLGRDYPRPIIGHAEGRARALAAHAALHLKGVTQEEHAA
jgi:hypothetical protein